MVEAAPPPYVPPYMPPPEPPSYTPAPEPPAYAAPPPPPVPPVYGAPPQQGYAQPAQPSVPGYGAPPPPMAPQPWQTGPIGGPAPSGPLPSGPLPPAPGGYQPAYPPQPQAQGYYQPVVVVQPQNTSNTAVIVEIICGIFGIYGIGWLMSGYTGVGLALLLVGILLWAPIFWVVTVFTVGIGLVCLIPIGIAIWVTSALLLNGKLKQRRMGLAR